ncbi:hypothetical protein MPSEU_000148900 [Mayamaea pseudoterrestris]|nr:hypothetical protein MPSEU_000148900 [Mayamaea pseudoterrestris]
MPPTESRPEKDAGVIVGPTLTPSELDKKLYRLILLPNGLKCLLIEDVLATAPIIGNESDDESTDDSDVEDERKDDHHGDDDDDDFDDVDSNDEPELRDAAVCIVVGVGSMYDPPECQGLAHFLEHLLFMGSSKYPKENDYDSFVTKRGGSANAWTEWEHTSYSLEIPQDSLWGALDRLAQFFIDPLMLPSAVDRELNAIESEFMLHKNSDSVRRQALLSATCRENHPIAKFAWGNKRSLRDIPAQLGVDPLERLWDFYKSYYFAANMRLVLCSAYSLDVMQRKVLELFQNVPALPRSFNGNLLPISVDPDSISSWDTSSYNSPMADAGSPLEQPRIYRIVPVKDRHALSITWSLPPIFADWRCKPYDFLAHLLGHEASGSLLAYMKSKSWATDCMAGVGEDGCERASSHALFTISLTLSEQGVMGWKSIVDATYQYIGMLRKQSMEGWPPWMFDELQRMHELSYRYEDEQSPDELVEGIADDFSPHADMPPERLLDGSSLMFDFDAVAIQKLLDEYLVPGKARIDLSSSTFGQSADYSDNTAMEGIETKLCHLRLHVEEENFNHELAGKPNVEPMFGTTFWCSEIPEHYIEHWSKLAEPQAPTIAIHLPPRNPFIPTKFELKPLPDHDSRHPLINCSLKVSVRVGKKVQWLPATPIQYDSKNNLLLLSYEGDNEQWHAIDKAASDAKFTSLRAGDEGTLDKKRIKFRVLSVSHSGSAPRLFGDGTDFDVEDGTAFPPIPPALAANRLPQEISNTNVLKMWFMQDRHFHRPTADFRAQIVCAQAHLTSIHRAAADLLMELVVDALTEPAYLASLCDLTYSIEATNIGFSVSASGYDDNIMSLVIKVLDTLFSFRKTKGILPSDINEKRFGACIELLERKYKNAGMNASSLCSNIRLQCICPSYWSANEKLKALSSLKTVNNFMQTANTLLSDFAIEALYHGNIDKTDAVNAKNMILQLVGTGMKGLARKSYPSQSVLKIPRSTAPTIVRVPSVDPAEPNTAVELYIQVAKDNLRERVLLDLLVHILEEPLYDQLRTKEQMGYDVSCDTRWSYGIMGIVFHIVTNVMSAEATLDRVLKFLHDQRKELETLKDFGEYVNGLARQKLTSFNSLTDATNHYWSEIRDGSFQWQSWRDEAICLQGISKDELLQTFDKIFALNNMVAVQVIGHGEGEVSLQRPNVDGPNVRDFLDAQIAVLRGRCKNQTWGRINSKLF